MNKGFPNWHIVKISGILILSGIFCGILSCSQESKNNTSPPNVLFIAIDDLNDWTGFLGGHPQVLTPHLDALAEEGMVFERAYVATSECNPSRAAMLSGYHSKTTGFTNNFLPISVREWKGIDRSGNLIPGYSTDAIPRLSEVKTLPQWFREHGYRTIGTGKIFHSYSDSVQLDFEKSWDEYGFPKGINLTRYGKNLSGICDGRVQWVDWGPVETPTEKTLDYNRAVWAREKLENYASEKPFFMAVGFQKPHDPFYAPREFFELYPDTSDILLPEIYDNGVEDNDHNNLPYMGKIMADKKPGVLSEYEIIKGENEFGKDYRKDVVRAYMATISFVDSCIGVVLDALENSPYAENTIVLAWSDHGWHLGEKLHYHKFTHWDQAMRSVFVLKAPGFKPGRSERLVNAIDIYPTLVDLCGLPSDYLQEGYDKQGMSLVPLLENPEMEWARPSVTSCSKRFPPIKKRGEDYSDSFLSHGLRTEYWKFIEYTGKDQREYELYYLPDDPEEWNNLAEKPEYQEILEKLATLLHKFPGGEDGQQKPNSPPSIIISAPLPDQALPSGKPVEVLASCMDIDHPGDIAGVEFFSGNESLGRDEEFPYSLKIGNPISGQTIRAIVTDRSGLQDEHTITLKIQ